MVIFQFVPSFFVCIPEGFIAFGPCPEGALFLCCARPMGSKARPDLEGFFQEFLMEKTIGINPLTKSLL
jgi:hypothetical protein